MDSSSYDLKSIKRALTGISCQSTDCVFGHPGGMGVAGRCNCLENLAYDKAQLRHVREALWEVRAILRGADV